MITVSWILLGLIALIALWLIFTYNRLVALKNRAEEAWSDIDVQLKRRYDLIPNLVATVKGYAKHESGLFEKITQLRAAAMTAKGPAEKAQAENQLTETLKTLFAVSENYPELKASANFLQLQDELSDTENKVQAARRFYNSNVLNLNTKIHSFPINLIAGAFGFSDRQFFELTEAAAREPVKVTF